MYPGLPCTGFSVGSSVPLTPSTAAGLAKPLSSGSPSLSSSHNSSPVSLELSSESVTSLLQTVTMSSPVASPSTTDLDIQAWLEGHNSLRQQHGAANLTWSDTLASDAQSWADGCVFEHSGGQYGENLFAGAGGTWPVSSAIENWASEEGQSLPCLLSVFILK